MSRSSEYLGATLNYGRTASAIENDTIPLILKPDDNVLTRFLRADPSLHHFQVDSLHSLKIQVEIAEKVRLETHSFRGTRV